MSDEKEENRINIEDLPQPVQELTAEEARDVKGGLLPAVQKVREAAFQKVREVGANAQSQPSGGNIVQGNLIGTD